MSNPRGEHPASLRSSFLVGIVGSGYWPQVLGEIFRRAEIAFDLVNLPRGRDKIRWALHRGWRQFDVVHLVGGMDWRMMTVLALAGRRMVIHWLGSDVLHFKGASQRGWRGRLHRRCACHWAVGHVADSPDLRDELRSLGLQAEVVRLLPARIEADVLPLPPRPVALSYWFDGQAVRDFYGGDIVLQLAREFPEIEFRIMQATGAGESAPPNVRFLGHQQDMEPIYREASVLIRLTRHDSVSAMVLEMLARGRYVIYSKAMECCHFASTLAEARTALRDIVGKTEPHVAGVEMIKREFSLAREAESLRRFYAKLSRRD